MEKKIFTLFLAFMAMLTVTAQVVQVDEVNMTRGYDAEIVVKYNISEARYGFQMDMPLPDGITITSCALGDGLASAGYQLSWKKLSSGTYRFMAYNLQNEPISEGEGELLRINIHADENMAMATYLVMMAYFEMTNQSGMAVETAGVYFYINVQIEIEDEDDLQEYLDWLAERERMKNQNVNPQAPDEDYDDLQAFLDLLADISLTQTVEQPEHTDLTINGGSFLPVDEWTDGTVFDIPETSTLTLQNNTVDCTGGAPTMMPGKARAKGDAQMLKLFNVTGTLHLAEGTKVIGRASSPTAISMAPNAKVYLEGATLKNMTLNLNEGINVYSSKPIAEEIDVVVPEGCLREGFRLMAPADGYSFTFEDALAVRIANSEDFCAEVDEEGYLSLFPMSKLGDVNNDGEVSIMDVSLVVQYLLGDAAPEIRMAAANVVRDNEISISDIQAIVNLILKN